VAPDQRAASDADLRRALGAGSEKEHHSALTRIEPWSGTVERGWDVNFLGVKTRVANFSLHARLGDYSQRRELRTSPPIHNEEYFEWVDLLEAVFAAGTTFRMIELGAGWGRWLANGIAVARHAGIDYDVIGVEAEPKHFKWMKSHLAANGVDLSKATLIPAAVAATDGEVWFHVGAAADWYGQRIEESGPDPEPPQSLWRRLTARLHRTSDERKLVRVRAVSLNSLIPPGVMVDLIDADVQGSEAEVFEAAAHRLIESVRRVHIGTHSDENEDRLRRLFGDLGWENVNDYPHGRDNETPYGWIPFQDGVQTWINPRLANVGKAR
jgi:FkbM family methyltransferase